MESIKVASKTKAKELSDNILGLLPEEISLDCIGAGAINQAIKAVAIINESGNLKISCSPQFFLTYIRGEEKSGIKLFLKEEK